MASRKYLGIVVMLIATCFLCTNLNTIRNEIARRNLNSQIPEARQEFADTAEQILFEDDNLIAQRLDEPHIFGEPSDCIWGSTIQIFSSVNDYNTTLEHFVEQFENLEWISTTNPEITPAYLINYESPNRYMSFAVYPLSEFDLSRFDPSEFDLFQINSLNDLVDQDNVYVIFYTYHYPYKEICVF